MAADFTQHAIVAVCMPGGGDKEGHNRWNGRRVGGRTYEEASGKRWPCCPLSTFALALTTSDTIIFVGLCDSASTHGEVYGHFI